MNLAVFCSGVGSNFEALCEAAKKNKLGARIAVMVCDCPGAFALKRASKYGIPTVTLSPKLFKTREGYEKVIVQLLKSQKVGFIALAGFMRVFSPYFIKAFRGRIVNIHPSTLPAFKGAHAIRDAFEAGVKETGVTVHLVNEKVDSGKILAQEKVKVAASDTLASLEKRIHAVEHKFYPKTLRSYLKQLK